MSEDTDRQYSLAEELRLLQNLHALLCCVHRGELVGEAPGPVLIRRFHRALFSGVRDHAGRNRRADFGSENLSFGPNRSVHRSRVETELDSVFAKLRRSLRSLDANPDDPDYERGALHIAVWAHAEVIRIHPFEDGNGRSSRALMDWILGRAGLRPIPVEAPKQDYHACLNHYYRTRDLQPLLDLMLSLYPLPSAGNP